MRGVLWRRHEPMSRQDSFSVALFGFSAHEQRVLRLVFELSSTRSPSFSLAHPALIERADICLVDAEDADAIRRWEQLKPGSAAVMAARQIPAENRYGVRRPLIATRLLAVLERLAIEQLNYTSALALDSTEDPPVVARSAALPANAVLFCASRFR